MTDKDTARAKRAARYVEMDKAAQPNPASLQLQRAKRDAGTDHRVEQYTRIERGKDA